MREDSCSFRCDSMKLLDGEGGPAGFTSFMSDTETSKSARSLLTESFVSMLVFACEAFFATSFETELFSSCDPNPTCALLAFAPISEELRGEAMEVLACLSAFT